MKPKLFKDHYQKGRWIFVPIFDILIPSPGRMVFGPRWWSVTENDEVLFFDGYGSPQCNECKSIAERIGKGFDAPPTHPRFFEMTFIPHRCE